MDLMLMVALGSYAGLIPAYLIYRKLPKEKPPLRTKLMLFKSIHLKRATNDIDANGLKTLAYSFIRYENLRFDEGLLNIAIKPHYSPYGMDISGSLDALRKMIVKSKEGNHEGTDKKARQNSSQRHGYVE